MQVGKAIVGYNLCNVDGIDVARHLLISFGSKSLVRNAEELRVLRIRIIFVLRVVLDTVEAETRHAGGHRNDELGVLRQVGVVLPEHTAVAIRKAVRRVQHVTAASGLIVVVVDEQIFGEIRNTNLIHQRIDSCGQGSIGSINRLHRSCIQGSLGGSKCSLKLIIGLSSIDRAINSLGCSNGLLKDALSQLDRVGRLNKIDFINLNLT